VNFVESIARKRDGGELTAAEIRAMVTGVTDGSIPDEQLAAMLMAICIRGASEGETRALVEAMRDSGAVWHLGRAYTSAVDKHSTGGVGDTVSLVFAPLVASCGVPVAMMAGAGLGHTQGTLDKLSAVPGFEPALSLAGARERLDRCGACFAAQSDEIAPADRRLYALRDVTGTVPSLPLIVASIMSKKLAVGAPRLVLDVKWGRGAFCKTVAEAERLALGLGAAGRAGGVAVATLITDMNEPLGDRLGTSSEVRAALEVLEGRGDARLRDLTLELAAAALAIGGGDRDRAEEELQAALEQGRARAKWDEIVRAHGGDPDPARLAAPRERVEVGAPAAGFVREVDGEALGWLAVALGAGRRRLGDAVDPAAGVVVHARVGDRVEMGSPLATLEVGDRAVDAAALRERARGAFVIGDAAPAQRPLVCRRLEG
jgi:pyrimidine-nucleoside phosphorylase